VTRRRRRSRALPVALALALGAVLLAGCRGALDQSALEPRGPQAESIYRLGLFATIVATIFYVGTLLALAWAARRARRHGEEVGRSTESDTTHEATDQRGMRRAVSFGMGATLAALLLFFSYDLSVGRSLNNPGVKNPLTVEVVGHQWWWEVRYADTSAHGRFVTANEVHIPVGRPVRFILTAADVIHSIWVPNLSGKKDLVPGYQQEIWFQADTAGTYRGQCAEFCGQQHAKMAMFVIAEPQADYERWVRAQRQPASPASTPAVAAGERVFMSGTCAMCHAVSGTQAGSAAGPDLTHVASRRTLAAGTIPNNRGNLAGWIVDPQRIKPGNHMPPNALSSEDLDALLTYLQSLK
jgi:cytochrome c oxidase subunit 2